MNNQLVKSIVGTLAFFLAYIGMDYLIDHKVDWIMASSMTLGYAIATIILYFINKKKVK